MGFWPQAVSGSNFGILILVALAVTRLVEIPGIARYDLLLIVVLLIQVILLVTHYENPYDLIPIMVFHVLGLALEIYKVNLGSWSYPGPGFAKIMGVPIYSGFMYSAIGSYIVRAIKEFKIRVKSWPRAYLTIPLACVIYLNYFTDTHWIDIHDVLYLLILIVFWRAKFIFIVRQKVHEWLVVLAYFLIGLFIYFAENIGSYLGAWRYSYQLSHWRLVDAGKLSSWVLLIIVSIVIVMELQRYFSGKIKNVDNIMIEN